MFPEEKVLEAARLSQQGPTGDEWLDLLYRTLVPPTWGKILEDGTRDPNHEEPYYRFLYYLARLRRPEVAIELGVDRGLGSAHMAAGCPRTCVFGIDHNPRQTPQDIERRYINYRYLVDDTVGVVPILIDDHGVSGKIGLMFVDSSHLYPETVAEWEAYLPLLAPDPILVYDDVTKDFDVLQFFEERPGKKLKFPDMHRGNCIGVILL